MKTTLLRNVNIPGCPDRPAEVLFCDTHILYVGKPLDENSKADTVINGSGLTLLPGAIDAHVHFRQPGLMHKATIASESHAARAGGVTAFFDMPNTIPQTTTEDAWAAKMDMASHDSEISYAFFLGATNSNLDEILKADSSRIPGIKVFLGSSTGNMLVDDEKMLDSLFASVKIPIVVHAEDEEVIAEARSRISKRYDNNPPVSEHSNIRPVEACVSATTHAIELLRRHPSAHLHIAHLSTADEVELVRRAKAEGLDVTAEVSPHHLIFSSEDYGRLGSRIKMNPSLKGPEHREALRRGVIDGTIDIIATDHAPHTIGEKQGNALTAVSGAPMVQFSLPLILDLFGVDTAVRTMCVNPAVIFGLKNYGRIERGYVPDMVLVENVPTGYNVSDGMVLSKCRWTPLAGHRLYHRIAHVFNTPCALRFEH